MGQDPTNMSVPVRNITSSPPRWANLYNDGRLASSDGKTKHLKDGVFKVTPITAAREYHHLLCLHQELEFIYPRDIDHSSQRLS
ncbi:hypothetical protein J6590_089369 [Homalodisca vitripennis]|nr:hypothetical protein J6590_089369 [Homalodisca vitripennis]